MAGVKFRLQTEAITTGTSKICLAQLIASSNHRVMVKSIGISFNGVSTTQKPVLVEIVRQSDAGTMESLTLKKYDPDYSETLQSTAQESTEDSTASNPTETEVVKSFYVHPQTGEEWSTPFGWEVPVPGGTRLGVCVTVDSTSIEALVNMLCEE